MRGEKQVAFFEGLGLGEREGLLGSKFWCGHSLHPPPSSKSNSLGERRDAMWEATRWWKMRKLILGPFKTGQHPRQTWPHLPLPFPPLSSRAAAMFDNKI